MSRLSVRVASLAFFVLGCSSKSTPPTGAKCAVNTDCNNPLSCAFGVCHEVCHETRDCPEGHRCITAPGGAGTVCQQEAKCAYKSDCPVPLVCALDRQCRNECHADVDCTKGQKCVLPDMVCAEVSEVDPTSGKLKMAQPGDVPAAPDGGLLDARAADGPVSTIDAAVLPPGADGGSPELDGPVAVDAPPLPPDLNLGDLPVGPCGFQDPNEPVNDTRNTAPALAAGVPVLGCVAGKSTAVDGDYFELVAPAGDPAGGYFQVSVSDVGDGRVGLTVFAGADNAVILEPIVPANSGVSVNAFFAAAPGQHYRLLVAQGGYDFEFKQPYRYTITATYTKVSDGFEPNDTRADAKAITLGTAVTAYAFAGFTTGHEGWPDGHLGWMPTADWYKVDLHDGMAKVTVANTASDVRALLFLYNPLGTEVMRADSQNGGAGASVTAAVTAGTYYVLVLASDPGPQSAGASAKVSQSFTMPYTLTVTE